MMRAVTYYRLMLRDGTSVVVDGAAARRLVKAGRVLSVREVGRNHPLYQRAQLLPLSGAGYWTKD